jgi:hypothetical protein
MARSSFVYVTYVRTNRKSLLENGSIALEDPYPRS